MEQPVELTEQDERDLARLQAEPDGIPEPTFHPILKVWQAVLEPAEQELNAAVTPQWANRIVSAYAGVTFADMLEYRERYFSKIIDLARILDDEIEGDADCLKYTQPEEDAEHNSAHYKNVLLNWQMMFLTWEMEWDTADPQAATELAAISEVHKMFFGDTGLTQFLDNIKFEFTEADQMQMTEALEDFKGGNRE